MSTLPEGHRSSGPQKAVYINEQQVDGGVHIHMGDAPIAQPALLRPPRNLPPRQSDTFAGRERELRDLHACFAHEAVVGVTQQAAVHSHGGVGKTSLAIEYGWRHLDDYPGGVFFLSCERAPVPPLVELAPYLSIRSDGSAEETAALVKARLEAGAPSLLILDNVEGSAQWLGGRWNRLLPQSPCRRLVTTRATLLAGVRMIPLERLSAEDGLQLLANFREDAREEPESAAKIVEWFDGLAVGLTVVGVYMQMNPLLSWKAYADDLEGRGLDTVRATEAEIGEAIEYEGRAGSVFDDVLEALPAAERRALEYAALLPEDNVYAPWLVELLDGDDVEVRARPGYVDAPARQVVDMLVSRQLLCPRGGHEQVLSLHRVLRRHLVERVSDALRYSLLNRLEELAKIRGQASQKMMINAGKLGELTPLAALAETLDGNGRPATAIQLTNSVCPIFYALGRYAEGRALIDRFVGSPKQESAGPETAGELLRNSALILQWQGELPAARRHIEQVIAIQEQQVQSDPTELSYSLWYLAEILLSQDELSEARKCLQRAITIQQQHSRVEEPILALFYSRLALTLPQTDELSEARRRMEQQIAQLEQQFQLGTPALATYYGLLANVLEGLGDLAEASRCVEQAIAFWAGHQVRFYPTLASCYSDLAIIRARLGEFPESRHCIEQAIAIRAQHPIPAHPRHAFSYDTLGEIMLQSGDIRSACELFHRANAILQKTFPPEHPRRQALNRKVKEFCAGV